MDPRTEFNVVLGKDYDPSSGRVPLLPIGEAKGAIPVGTRVQKVSTREGDLVPNGTKGIVLSSFDVDPDLKKETGAEFLYMVEWDSHPGLPVGISSFKVKVVK